MQPIFVFFAALVGTTTAQLFARAAPASQALEATDERDEAPDQSPGPRVTPQALGLAQTGEDVDPEGILAEAVANGKITPQQGQAMMQEQMEDAEASPNGQFGGKTGLQGTDSQAATTPQVSGAQQAESLAGSQDGGAGTGTILGSDSQADDTLGAQPGSAGGEPVDPGFGTPDNPQLANSKLGTQDTTSQQSEPQLANFQSDTTSSNNPLQKRQTGNFDCRPALTDALIGNQNCPITYVSGTTYRASCGTFGVLDFSPGSGTKLGRLHIENRVANRGHYSYLLASGGERQYFDKLMEPNSSCDWQIPAGQAVGQVAYAPETAGPARPTPM